MTAPPATRTVSGAPAAAFTIWPMAPRFMACWMETSTCWPRPEWGPLSQRDHGGAGGLGGAMQVRLGSAHTNGRRIGVAGDVSVPEAAATMRSVAR